MEENLAPFFAATSPRIPIVLQPITLAVPPIILGRPELKLPVWTGVISAVALSLGAGIVLYQLGALFEGDTVRLCSSRP